MNSQNNSSSKKKDCLLLQALSLIILPSLTGKIVEKKVCSSSADVANGPSRVLLTTSPAKPTHADVQVSEPRLLNKVNF